MDWLMGKGRRREKEPLVNSDTYLDDIYSDSIIEPDELAVLVQIPPGVDETEWIASHTISFFEHINLMYGIVSEYCTHSQCSTMSAPCNLQYPWIDERGKKSRCSASQYVDYVMTYIQQLINDESVFPTKYDNKFSEHFDTSVKKIHKLLIHVLGHIYHAHFDIIVSTHLHTHLNGVLLHFVIFSQLHSLISQDDIDPLMALFQKLNGNTTTSAATTTASNATNDYELVYKRESM